MRFLIQIDNNDWFVSTAAGQTNVGVAGNFSAGAAEFAIPFSNAGANWGCVGFDGQLGAASSGFPILQGDISASALTDPLPSGNITFLNANNQRRRLFAHVETTESRSLELVTSPSSRARFRFYVALIAADYLWLGLFSFAARLSLPDTATRFLSKARRRALGKAAFFGLRHTKASVDVGYRLTFAIAVCQR